MDHFPADKGEKSEGDPMVIGADQVLDTEAGKPADDRHHPLKKAEMETEAEELSFADRMQGHSGGKRHGKGIHGKGDGDEEKGEWFHVFRRALLTSTAFMAKFL